MVWGRKKAISNEYSNNGAKLLKEQVSNGATRRKPYPLRIFTAQELRTATRSFRERMNQTDDGTYYKGTIDGRPVSVLRSSDPQYHSDNDRKINEIVLLSSVRHPSLVKLLGCCLETDDPLLVYEFVPNGNLLKYLNSHDVRWSDRLRIATEIAEALAYLHHHGPTPIVHRSVNPYNVMLDESYSAKLTGFRMSVAIPLGEDSLEDVLEGTIGYIDPECLATGMVTLQSDVYLFGVLLFTILTGKPPSDYWNCKETMEQAATDFVMEEGEELRLEVEVQAFYELFLRCTELTGERRPTMKEVVRELWKISRMGAIHQIASPLTL